ncbi:uncharacterized protein BO72DRAFT_99869 [Aspergillus fijiensis CBS 313.89]|uniref:Uncharacterized protein n=1 Tax=Aspergillus fijiensis CBS 313.89 TaxID=1448319 RepID=A0A8G1VZR0_9EURO|nr:uncharacterized protein BO72DRAFT_99869 [Aspergillus fijiensis CBS 313.89]RAK77566.1 hypothetical protein BO72DRAFT_99869 [Aspergillus fijiensis CBS 313.89]
MIDVGGAAQYTIYLHCGFFLYACLLAHAMDYSVLSYSQWWIAQCLPAFSLSCLDTSLKYNQDTTLHNRLRYPQAFSSRKHRDRIPLQLLSSSPPDTTNTLTALAVEAKLQHAQHTYKSLLSSSWLLILTAEAIFHAGEKGRELMNSPHPFQQIHSSQ